MSRLQKVIRNGFEFLEMAPAPAEKQLNPLPRAEREQKRSPQALQRMRDLAALGEFGFSAKKRAEVQTGRQGQ